MNKAILILTIPFISLIGCSAITNGSNETISFSSQEEGTKLYVDGAYRGKDFTSITVDRGIEHTVVAKKEGCKTTTLTTDYSFQWGKSLFLNVLIDFGIISIPTDLLSGAAWKTDQANYDVTPNCALQ